MEWSFPKRNSEIDEESNVRVAVMERFEVRLKLHNLEAMNSVFNLVVLFLVVKDIGAVTQGEEIGFTYNGFKGANLSLDIAEITSNGLLMLNNATRLQKGHAFYANPIQFLNASSLSGTAASALSFSVTFVFAIVPSSPDLSGHGMAFVITPTRGFSGAFPSQYLGIFSDTNIGNSSNHILAVELDTVENWEFDDINGNHIGIDINGLKSVASAPASFFDNTNGRHENLSLSSGHSMQVWVNYDGVNKQLNVTLAPINVPKPSIPLLSLHVDLSPVMQDYMFVGFSSSTGSLMAFHYVLGWSFKLKGQAEELNLHQIPKLPRIGPKKKSTILTIGVPVLATVLVLLLIFCTLFMVIRKRKFAEVLEGWELNYGPHRFKYKDLYVATKGFKQKELLGIGGFGRVYKGILPNSKFEVAVKKVSHESRQGMKEFVAEIVSIGKLRHRNLVTLLGYCRRKGELLLVYEFMPNGSLDKFLFDPNMPNLNWCQRFRIIRGIASALFYLHEGWEQVVIHRDVKSSNVLLDAELNGRLGDFGLARLYDHGADPQTTHVVGTLGYLAPEFSRTGKANPSTDVFAFGMFMFEVVSGRRPIDPSASSAEDLVLVDRIFSRWREGTILDIVDPNLGKNYVEEEMDLVVKLGLLCTHCVPTGRPSMRQVVQYLEGELPLPDLSSLSLSAFGVTFADGKCFNDFIDLCATASTSITESQLSGGR